MAAPMWFFALGFGIAFATHSNIDPSEPNHWAWNDVVGWIDFCVPTAGNTDCALSVKLENNRLTGYASSSVGYIAFDCATAPTPPSPSTLCDTGGLLQNWKVTQSASTRILSGWAWNDVIGWINFNCNDLVPACSSGNTNYNVWVDANGVFQGWAWNDVVGWISFNCVNPGTNGCTAPDVDYKVKLRNALPPSPSEGYLVSSVFDTCPAGTADNQSCGSAGWNSILWHGSPPAGATQNPGSYVRFQIASSECKEGGTGSPPLCGGSWGIAACNAGDSCFLGSDGTISTFYEDPQYPLVPIPIKSHHNNKRYVRYKAFLYRCVPSACPSASSPVVRDIIINWSP